MDVLKSEVFPIRTPEELGAARRAVLAWATALGLGTVDRTKFVTCASELGRNALVHGKGGEMTMSEIDGGGRAGLRLVFEDRGPGISDIAQAMTDGFSSANSMGKGLGGARRLANEFDIQSAPGQGTRVTVVQWKRR